MENRSFEIVNEVKKVIVGKDEVITKTLMAILAGGHILLEDVPGVGKTQLALAFSKAMSLRYKRVQFTPDTMASDLVGFTMYNKETDSFVYKQGALACNLFLGDEINRTSAKTQSALLEAMEELQITVDGKTYMLPDPFICIATQNPLGSAGTHALPDSQLDRFMIKLSMGYPSIENQVDIVKQRKGANPLESVVEAASLEDINDMKAAVANVHIDDEVIEYAATLCEKTRNNTDILQGASPRAVLSLVQMARACAFINERDYVVPSDVASLFADVCAHRVILTPKAKVSKTSAEEILQEIVKNTQAPRP
ncbi:MAG: MoxR family ATPase [Clostridia bacterium]|nr:MoxR family ATPase [Clostridia bacterium]